MIVICLENLPDYSARAVGAFAERTAEKVVVVRVPMRRFSSSSPSELTHCPVVDVVSDDKRSIVEVVGEMPRAIMAGGWSSRCFIRWAHEIRNAGGVTILGTDEAFENRGLKQMLRKLRFKILFENSFDFFFVVGAGGVKQLVDYYGVARERVFTGGYGSDPETFFNGAPLAERPKRFLYVGHFDANKNVLPMCEAFLRVHERHPDWELEICGGGELESVIPRKPGIVLTGFVKNTELGEKYRNARCLVLGSFSEKWGVVVHEACASGCMLVLSNAVGSRYDFAHAENAATFDPADVAGFERAMEAIVEKTGCELEAAQTKSVACAQHFSPKFYAAQLSRMVSAGERKEKG